MEAYCLADQPLGSRRALGESHNAQNIQNQQYTYAADTGSSNAYAIALSPPPTAYTAGQTFVFKAGFGGTGACTLNVNGLGAIAIKKNGSAALASGDIASGQIVAVVYDGTNFQMFTPLASANAYSSPLSMSNGGTGANLSPNNGGIVWTNGSTMQVLNGTATAGQMLQSGASATPAWSTATWPSTVTASNLLYSNGANTVTGLATANGGVLVTSNTGVPSILAGSGTTGTILQCVSGAAPAWSTATYPATTTVSQILYSSSTNVVGGIATANGGVLVTNNTGVPSILAGSGTTGTVLQATASGTPAWSTATYPATTTINQILYSSSANVVGGITTGNNGILITSGGGVPSISSTLPNAVQLNITALGTIATGVWQGTVVGAQWGGTGVNNGSNTIILAGNVNLAGALTTSGAFGVTFTFTNTTSVTFPTSGTLATTTQVQNAGTTYAADTGSANAYAIALSPALTSYTAGQTFSFKAANTNTGASTLAVNGLATKNITNQDLTALNPGDILANAIVEVEYDGTQFQLLSIPMASNLVRDRLSAAMRWL